MVRSSYTRDRTNVAPVTTRDIEEPNYMYAWVQGVGLALLAFAWILSLMCVALLIMLRKDSLVQRAQPFFMMLLCAGYFFIATSILTLSFDEGAGWSTSQLSIACMSTMWFFFVGQIMTFSALFTKLGRLDKVLQFRRGNKVTVTVLNVIVIGPLAGLTVVTLLILSVWTAIEHDPWRWNRVIMVEVPPESYGQCECSYFWAFFGPLMAVLLLAEGLTAFFAWKTVDVPEDFRDCKAVSYAILTQLQGWIIGVPILAVLGSSSSNATYFGRVLVIWIFSVASVGIVVAPRIAQAIMIRRNPEF